ncbi:MAG TPA: Rrf2 family transcriptional regulator [Verrucomicrobiae bacterium]|nr:Rrf2 family transcriptional regulator [Verrucomicrobiae bacterium]
MRITKQSEYGLAAILYLASQPEGKLSFRGEIASRCEIPGIFLAQILSRLRQRGILGSRRGARGGYFLRVEPHRLTLADVLDALEGKSDLIRSIDGAAGDPAALRQSPAGIRREAFRRLQERGRELLRSIKIGELLSGKGRRFESPLAGETGKEHTASAT